MTAVTAQRRLTPTPAAAAVRLAQEIGSLTGRNLLRIARSPQRVMFTLITPVMFTLLFRYVFGGAIGGLHGVSYPDYLIPGVALQVTVLASVTSGFSVADDLATGYYYRLRTLPTHPAAVFLARVAADLVNMAAQLLVLVATGLAVGYRPGSVPGLIGGCALVLLFGIGLGLAFAAVGLWAAKPEAVNAVAMPLVFPLTLASSAFVPPATMPGWLRGFAGHQPVSVACDSLRALALGGRAAEVRPDLFAGQSTPALIGQTVVWSVGIGAAAIALALRRYRRLNG